RCKGHRYYNAALRRCIKGSRLSGALCGLEAYVHRFAGLYERGISAYLAPSRFMRDKMVEFGLAADRIIHLPNFLNLEDYEPCFSSKRYVVYAGRLERAKGVGTLIEAFGRSDLASRFELRIAGDGNLQAELAANCRASRQDNVRFLGRLSRAEM